MHIHKIKPLYIYIYIQSAVIYIERERDRVIYYNALLAGSCLEPTPAYKQFRAELQMQ